MSYVSRFHVLKQMLAFSFVEMLLAVVLSLIFLVLFIIPLIIADTPYGEYFHADLLRQSETFLNFERISIAVNSSQFAGDAAVFIAWAVAGLIAYFIFEAFINSVRSAAIYANVMEHFKQQRLEVSERLVARIFVRIATLGGILVLYKLTFTWGIPTVVFLVQHAAEASLFGALWRITLALVLVLAIVHLFVILLRTMLLKTRIFYTIYNSSSD